ncbi:DUF4138 domain-containing protein [Puia dinghuensis]|uniref:Uncharacterized protein n=1 Tax=Puia dinghuensis TaxID=1792502 RepID=A0A8J2U6Q6_9BACT|nr:DUF4138 domain-containing protein [Puia dinghuensis]GGA82299.1 hypothetical protein GCM10011511_01580 [Puia dinghuensis]
MTKLFILLTGYLLLSQPTYSVAQNIRSSVEYKSPRAPDIRDKDPTLKRCCEKIMKATPCIFFLHDRNGKMRFRVLGVYTHGATLFFLLRLNNRSSLDYDVDSIRFAITAAAGAKGLHPGSKALQPVYIYDSTATVPGFRRATTIYALRRFTLLPGRQLQIVVWERNGGRHLRIQATNNVLERARRI